MSIGFCQKCIQFRVVRNQKAEISEQKAESGEQKAEISEEALSGHRTVRFDSVYNKKEDTRSSFCSERSVYHSAEVVASASVADSVESSEAAPSSVVSSENEP